MERDVQTPYEVLGENLHLKQVPLVSEQLLENLIWENCSLM